MDLNKWKMDKLDKILRDLRIYIDEERGIVSDNLHHKYGKEIKLLKLQHDKEMQANQLGSQVVVKIADIIDETIKEAKKDMDSISIGRVLALTELKEKLSKFSA